MSEAFWSGVRAGLPFAVVLGVLVFLAVLGARQVEEIERDESE